MLRKDKDLNSEGSRYVINSTDALNDNCEFDEYSPLLPNLSVKQAVVFLQDADEYRSIRHRIDKCGLIIYRVIFSRIWQIILSISIVMLHCLAFLEFPSSLSISPLINSTWERTTVEVDLSVTWSIEAICLLIILIDALLQTYLFGLNKFKRNPWLIVFYLFMLISWIDFFVSLGMRDANVVRIRRYFRPFFAIQKSQLMKKVLKSLSKTFVDIISAFALLFVWLVAFSLIAVSLFNDPKEHDIIDTNYETFYSAFFTLLVLTTTANNPDSMVKIYNRYRLAFIFFFIFMAVGIFVFMNVLIAIIFNEFRSHVLDSMQTSRFRRRIASRAMFEILRNLNSLNDEIEAETLRNVIAKSHLSRWRKNAMVQAINSTGYDTLSWDSLIQVLQILDEHKEERKIYRIPKFPNPQISLIQSFLLSKSFEIIGLLVCVANVIVIGFDISIDDDSSGIKLTLNIFNWIFIIYYVFEQFLKFMAMGYKIYFSKRGCIYDFIITMIIFVMKIVDQSLRGPVNDHNKLFGGIYLSDLSRITNLIILLRAARIVKLFPSLTPIISTLFDIPWRMKSVIGVLMLLFYEYALLGMAIFGDDINPDFLKNQTGCGDYDNLSYGGINFNDFFSSIVVLWCLLIVNNWQVFVKTFEITKHTKWVHLFMISWWVLVVIVVLNCITAFVIEAYTQRKSFYEEEQVKRTRPQSVADLLDGSIQYLRQSVIVNESLNFQMLFKKDLIEPTEDELIAKLKHCEHLCNAYPHISCS